MFVQLAGRKVARKTSNNVNYRAVNFTYFTKPKQATISTTKLALINKHDTQLT